MGLRFRIGPFTFGKSGIRLSVWRKNSGLSIPITGKKQNTFGKIKAGPFSYHKTFKSKSKRSNMPTPDHVKQIRRTHRMAYEPWTKKEDGKLIAMFRQGKNVNELSQIFGRTRGAIKSRINKLLME